VTEYCSICGNELTDGEFDICDNCKISIMSTDELMEW